MHHTQKTFKSDVFCDNRVFIFQSVTHSNRFTIFLFFMFFEVLCIICLLQRIISMFISLMADVMPFSWLVNLQNKSFTQITINSSYVFIFTYWFKTLFAHLCEKTFNSDFSAIHSQFFFFIIICQWFPTVLMPAPLKSLNLISHP